MNIRIWKPDEEGNPCARHYYYQFFQRKKRYRGVLEARNAEQAKQAAQQIWDEEWNRKYEHRVIFGMVGEVMLLSFSISPYDSRTTRAWAAGDAEILSSRPTSPYCRESRGASCRPPGCCRTSSAHRSVQ